MSKIIVGGMIGFCLLVVAAISIQNEQKSQLRQEGQKALKLHMERAAGTGYAGYDAVWPGMTLSQVQSILGYSPREVSGTADQQVYQWEYAQGSIYVRFVDGRLVAKSR